MITKEEILKLHHLSIEKYSNSHGLGDNGLGLLESAIAGPIRPLAEKIYMVLFTNSRLQLQKA